MNDKICPYCGQQAKLVNGAAANNYWKTELDKIT